jgi:hypothetical protein
VRPAANSRNPISLRLATSRGALAGQVLFLIAGAYAGFYYGGYGGVRFFSELRPNLPHPMAVALGGSLGVVLGMLVSWAILTVLGASLGALYFYWRLRGADGRR